MRRIFLILLALSLTRAVCAQEISGEKLHHSLIQARVPRHLRTMVPFWGTPVAADGRKQEENAYGTYIACRKDTLSLPEWVCWNLDLAADSTQRYKMERLYPGTYRPISAAMLREAVDECYRWAWRKPYGHTNIVVGPMYNPKGGQLPYAWFVAVCKKEESKNTFSYGYSSIAFVIPEGTAGHGNIYRMSMSVNAVEIHSGYNLFPKLPSSVQEQVEEMTVYELFCPFQEYEDCMYDHLDIEFEHETEGVEYVIE